MTISNLNPVSDIFFRAVLHSKNAKTGGIPQTYTTRKTCAVSCPFNNDNGCYGDGYHTARIAAECGEECARALDIDGLYAWAQSIPAGTLIRHNVVGDMCTPNTNTINKRLITRLIAAFKGRRAYTYTHCYLRDSLNVYLIQYAIYRGFVINASCETVHEVDYARAHGIPAVLTVIEPPAKGARTPAGHRLIQCLYETHGTQCKDCQLCARADRDCVVCLTVHGQGKKKASDAINRKLSGIGIKVERVK